MTTTVETITAKSQAVADLIEGPYNVYVCDDGAGPYISINDAENADTYRCLALNDEGECGDDLSKYRWTFWTDNHSVYETSLLGADAEAGKVVNFFTVMMQVEKSFKEA